MAALPPSANTGRQARHAAAPWKQAVTGAPTWDCSCTFAAVQGSPCGEGCAIPSPSATGRPPPASWQRSGVPLSPCPPKGRKPSVLAGEGGFRCWPRLACERAPGTGLCPETAPKQPPFSQPVRKWMEISASNLLTCGGTVVYAHLGVALQAPGGLLPASSCSLANPHFPGWWMLSA